MKRIFSFMVVLVLLLAGCASGGSSASDVSKYITNLDSYTTECDMTLNRGGKEIKADIAISYLKTDFYKVVFKNPNGYDQVILKNKQGVFVLTPGLDKEFKFNSEWPANTSHAYLVNMICNDIMKDTENVSELKDDTLTVKAKIGVSSPYYSKLEFSYDVKNKKPNYVSFLDDKDSCVVKATYKSFTANPKLSEADFNEDKVKKDFEKPSASTDKKTLDVSYTLDGVTLKSKTKNDKMTVMCYGGNKNYTIVIKEVGSEPNKLEEFNLYDFSPAGLVLKNDNSYRYYLNSYEIDIYTNTLEYADVISIIDGIKLV